MKKNFITDIVRKISFYNCFKTLFIVSKYWSLGNHFFKLSKADLQVKARLEGVYFLVKLVKSLANFDKSQIKY